MSIDVAISRISEIQHTIEMINSGPRPDLADRSRDGADTAAPSAALFGAPAAASLTGPAPAVSFGDVLQGIQAVGVPSLAAPAAIGATDRTAAGSSSLGERIVASAKEWIGVPYVLGGTTRSGVDCSGLVQNVLAEYGIDMPRLAREQMKQGTEVASLDQALPGDLLVFNNGSHIAIYAGDGMKIHAPRPGKTVVFDQVYGTPTTIRRMVPADDPTAPAATASTDQVEAQQRAVFEALLQTPILGGST